MKIDRAPMQMRRGTASGILAGFVIDVIVADPARRHPVAGMGRAASTLERAVYRDRRATGAAFTATCVVGAAVVGAVAGRLGAAGTAVAVWSTLGGTTLLRVGEAMAEALESGDVDAARMLLPSLCGRDPSSLDEAGLCRAAIESIAENTSDATVAPLMWAAVGGAPGAVSYRMINTLDAMVGYRTQRYHRFGWASARLDDVANLLPARLTALLAVLAGRHRRAAVQAWRADAAAHPSPNAGVVEASFAGALGISLGGTTVYAEHVEERPRLGSGRAPSAADLRAATALSRRVQFGAAALAFGVAVLRRTAARRAVDRHRTVSPRSTANWRFFAC